MEGMNPVKVYQAKDRLEAEILLCLLHEHKISAYCQGVGGGGIMDIYAGNSLFGEDIYVDKMDADKAWELIQGVVLEVETAEGFNQESEADCD